MIGDRIDVNIAGGLDVALPKMVHVRQKFQLPRIDDVTATVVSEFAKPDIQSKITPGMTVALGVGSRGVNNIAECVKAVVTQLKALGAEPFVFPAMGSHGGATAEGQKEVLDGYGVTEAYIGCPVKSSMEVVEIGKADDGMPVYLDKLAAEADAIAGATLPCFSQCRWLVELHDTRDAVAEQFERLGYAGCEIIKHPSPLAGKGHEWMLVLP